MLMLSGGIAGIITAIIITKMVTRWPTTGSLKITSASGWLLCLLTCFAVMGTVSLITWGTLITFGVVPKPIILEMPNEKMP